MSVKSAMLAAGLLSVTATAQAAGLDLNAALQTARANLTLDHGTFAGPAASILQAALKPAQFVMLGEVHLTRQVPQFAGALCAAMAPAGLNALVMEVGPEAARLANAALATPDPAASMAATLRHYPNAAAFLDSQDELEFAADCLHRAGAPARLWGLDQEFLGSAGLLLDIIAAEKLAPPARAAITRLQAIEQADAKSAAADGNPAKLFIFAANDADLQAARAALAAGGSQRAQAVFAALLDSRAIYLAHGINGPSGNRLRSLLMKRTLVNYMEQTGLPAGQQRLLLKFGDNHLYRGFNPGHLADIGNTLDEFADAHGTQTLHIAMLGGAGTALQFAGYARPAKPAPFDLTKEPESAWARPFLNNAYTQGWTVYDLRELRHRHLADHQPELELYIYGYDLLVVAPRLTAAKVL